MTRIIILMFLAAITLAIGGCDKTYSQEKITNIKRVMMHDTNHYTFFVQEGNELKTRTFIIGEAPFEPKIIMDVEQGAPMWAEATYYKIDGGSEGCSKLIIHLHNPEQIEGGWNHGKGGNGNTTVVE